VQPCLGFIYGVADTAFLSASRAATR